MEKKYTNTIPKEEFKKYTQLPYTEKIQISKEIIQEFLEDKNPEEIYISSSFGKDSVALIDLVRRENKDITIAYVNTGMEQPTCVQLSKKYPNVLTITPKMHMEEIIEKYGYILPIGKEKTNTIELCRKNLWEGKYDTVRVRKMRGDFGEKSLFNFTKYQHILLAPFKISDKCCHYLKIEPFTRLRKEYGYKYLFTGVTYDESRMRHNNLLQHGFNTLRGQSRPIGHWNASDVLRYITEQKLEIASCYGDIVHDEKGYHTTKFDRTGCLCCPIGSHVKDTNDFQTLYKYQPGIWDYVINKLGFKQVLEYFDIDYIGQPRTEDKEDVDDDTLDGWLP